MITKKVFFKYLTVITALTFLWTNCVWAGGIQTLIHSPRSIETLAARSVVDRVEVLAETEYINQAVVGTLLRQAAETNEAIRDRAGEIDHALQTVLDGLDTGKFLYGVLRNREQPEAVSFYRLCLNERTEQILAFRYSLKDQPADPLYEHILKDCVKHRGADVKIGDKVFNEEVIVIPPELRDYVLSIKWPGESPKGLAKSRNYNNDPVADNEKLQAEGIIADFESRGQVTDITDSLLLGIIAEKKSQYPQLDGKVQFKFVPQLVTGTGTTKRVFQAYSKKLAQSTSEGVEWIVYLSRDFIDKVNKYHATEAIAMLVSHEFDEITSGSHNEAERKELESGKIDIAGQPVSYLDAFIYYIYTDELGFRNADWWPELQRWMVWEKLRLIISAKDNDKVSELDAMKGEIYSLDQDLAKLDELTIDMPGGKWTLWDYVKDVCVSLQNFERNNGAHFPGIGSTNFQKLQEFAGPVFQDQDVRELFWLVAIFFQIGKTKDSDLGRYYLAGKDLLRGLLTDYYSRTGHVAIGKRDRLIKLGSELIYRFGNIRAIHMGHSVPGLLLKVKDIDGLSEVDQELLIKLIGIFTVVYTNHHTIKPLSDSVVDSILHCGRCMEDVERCVREQSQNWYNERLDIWFDRDAKKLVESTIDDEIRDASEKDEFRIFLRDVNLFNFYRTINDLSQRIRDAQKPEEKTMYAQVWVRMFYFLMKLSRYAENEWIIFVQDANMAEDMISVFASEEVKISDIDNVLNVEEGYIRSNFKNGSRVILFGIPLYLDGERMIIDLYRYGEGVEHGINKMNRMLDVAVRDAGGDLKGKYYDLLVVVTDEYSGDEMDALVQNARDRRFIPKNANVKVVRQPKDRIRGNWSSVINLMCDPDLQVDGVQLGEYVKGKNVAVILSAGAAKRNAPMTFASDGYSDKGKMPGYNGNPYLYQIFRQIMYYYNPSNTGMIVTTNDGTKGISQETILGRQGFQIIGAAKPARIGLKKKYNEEELGELGCMMVDLLGNILRFVEKPDEPTWRKELKGKEFVPTNWADYFLREDFLKEIAVVYGDLRDDKGNLLYLKYGLDTSKDFSEPCTLSLDEYRDKKIEDGWTSADAEKIWNAANDLKSRFKIGFVNAGKDAYFKDTGTNLMFKTLAKDILRDEKLRKLLGMTPDRGYRIIEGNLIGPRVKLGNVNLRLGKGNVIVGNVAIKEGKIGDDCVIIDSIVNNIELKDGAVVYGIYRPEAEDRFALDQDKLAVDVLLDTKKIKEEMVQDLGLKKVIFRSVEENGEEAIKEAIKMTIVLPVSSKASDEIFYFEVVDLENGERDVTYIRNGEVIKGRWFSTKGIKVDKRNRQLFFIGPDRQRIPFATFSETRPKGGPVWGLRIWPRLQTQRDWDSQPRVEQIDAAGGKISFEIISESLAKPAIAAFKKVLADSDSVLPIPVLMYPLFSEGEEESDSESLRLEQAGPIARKVRAEEAAVPIWQAELDENGGIKLGTAVELSAEHPKLEQIDLEKYERVRKKLIERYKGPGIFGAISGIRVVDNLKEKLAGETAPYAVVIEENGERYILIDVDAFKGTDDALYLILDHELKHSILGLLEDNNALEELAAIYMSLQEAIQQGYERPANLNELGPEAQFWQMLNELKGIEEGKRTDALVVSYAIEYMRQMPYYEKLFNELGINRDEWINAVKRAKENTAAAIEIYNQVAGIEPVELVEKVKNVESGEVKVRGRLTNVAGIEVPEVIAGVTKKIKMLVSSLIVKEMSMVQELLDNKKFVRLNIDELRNNTEVVNWLKELLRDVIKGTKESPFVFYSGTGQDAGQFLEEKFGCKDVFIMAEKKMMELSETDRAASVITVVDLERVNWDNELKETMYMPLFYSVTSIYLASQIVITNGNVSQIRDSLVRNTIELLYKSLLGDMVEQEGWDWVRLFIEPWNVLPPIISITDTLNALREAVAKIEVAA